MKKTGLIAVCIWAAFLMLLAVPGKCAAGIQVSINFPLPFPAVIASPPVVALPGPPRHVVVPHTDVYYYPDGRDTLYYDGYWYQPRGQDWYRARSRDGQWAHIARHRVPRAVVILPVGDHYRSREQRLDWDDRHDYRRERHWRN